MKNTKVLIADAHALTREGVKSILAKLPNLSVCAEALTSTELKNLVQTHLPEIVIIDYHITNHFSLDDVAWLKLNSPQTAIMIITTNKNKADVIKVLDYGVNSYLLKECDEHEVMNAVNASLRKEKFFCGRVMDAILEQVTHKCTTGYMCNHCMPVSLSDREEEIVRLIAQGLTTKEIADKLNLSFFTVGTHRKNIFKKINIRNSSELINYALKTGIITT